MEFSGTLAALREDLAACCQKQPGEVPWPWIATKVASLLTAHGNMTRTVLLTELEASWHSLIAKESADGEIFRTVDPFLGRSIPPPLSTRFHLKVLQTHKLPGTDIWLWSVCGGPSSGSERRLRTADKHMDMFVHERHCPMIDSKEFAGFFDQRCIYATNLKAADRGCGSGRPLLTLLPDCALVFEVKVGASNSALQDTAPTDELFLRDIFGVAFSRERFVHARDPIFDANQVWGKIERIERTKEEFEDGRPVSYATVSCLIEHAEAPYLVSIRFYDADIPLVRLFHDDDYIGLLCAEQASDTEFVYGPQTIAFIMRGTRASYNETSQTSVAYNDLGFFDYRRYAHQISIGQLVPEIINLTMMARVVAVSENYPTQVENGSTLDRYVLRIGDGTGVCDATVWGELGRTAARAMPGQLVVLHNFETHEDESPNPLNDSRVIINGSLAIHAQIFNISQMPGMLSCSELRGYSFLADIAGEANCYVRATVTGIHSAGDFVKDSRDQVGITRFAHRKCRRTVVPSARLDGTVLESLKSDYGFSCRRCKIKEVPDIDVVWEFALTAEIDDGTDCCTADVSPEAAATILGISPSQFLSLSAEHKQHQQLKSPLGLEFVISLTSFIDGGGDSGPLLRIEAACPIDRVGTSEVQV
ncbi:hypothetical protein DL89DRAFT_256159 [Linderina pennispora]|uniref:Cell division control protein 24 OB domain-containing protein n=1 Tax=Linderina pennispora TaxID=61395 RepID=A0A1Y1WCP2_9FUNG|nr:uncharacterized protein DL89DRAFT_256159 [Linderina pennispora]ORX71098.1 hypothetical protein DL89DRAFT_256159 [Linderina pennispora]